MTHTAAARRIGAAVPERLTYRIKRALLGTPLVTAQLHDERLSKKAALGVLSSDCISSSAYGTEEMLIFLLPAFGLAGFHLLMPLTLVVLLVLVVMTALYRQVVTIYTKAGGSYVVARENFGPRVAQIASVALLIDYIVTVAVQSAAGTAAVVTLVPRLRPLGEPITIGIVLVLAFGNLRGVREAGKAFAFPTYFFVTTAGLVVVLGVLRAAFGDLPVLAHVSGADGMIGVHDQGHAVFTGAAIYVLLKAFANGGASLTGLEAISNGVGAIKEPVGRNARATLTTMSALLGTLVLGISFLAWRTHATPYRDGTPTVIGQVAHAVFGHDLYGNIGFYLVQISTALILITGANTPFTGFPYLASFLAEDSFLPRQLTRRGHRLAFSNGIVVLTVAALALIVAVGTVVDALIPFYAIGVFTGFATAGYGMARYYRTRRTGRWRLRFAISLTGGVVSSVVVIIFAVVKFTQGAWLVVVLFPVLWVVLIRLNDRYRAEAHALDLVTTAEIGTETPHYARHTVLVLVDRLDLAVLRALGYAASLRPSSVQAVHFTLDDEVAATLQREWIDRALGDRVPLMTIDCDDRRLLHRIAEFALDTVVADRAEVTVLLPRRTFGRVSQRLLHDRTADRIAESVSRIPHVAATIVPFDTTLQPEQIDALEARRHRASSAPALSDRCVGAGELPATRAGVTPIGEAEWRQKVVIEGRVRSVIVGSTAGRSLEVQVFDGSGGIRLLFYGRTSIPGIEPGALLSASGRVGEYKGHLALANPRYQLLPAARSRQLVGR